MARKIKTNPFESRCNKCGKEQEQDVSKSTENWKCYPCGVKCDCGGEYVTWLNGKPIKPFIEGEK